METIVDYVVCTEPEFFKLLRTPRIDSTESIPCEKSIPLWQAAAHTTNRPTGILYRPAILGIDSWAPEMV